MEIELTSELLQESFKKLCSAEKKIKHRKTISEKKKMVQNSNWKSQFSDFVQLYTAIKCLYTGHSLKDITVLDLGCSHGFFIHLLKEIEKCEVYGIDLDENAVDVAQKLFSLEVFHGDAENVDKIVRGKIGEKIDVIVSHRFLVSDYAQMSFEKIKNILEAAKKVLARKGYIVISGELGGSVERTIETAKSAGLSLLYDFCSKEFRTHVLVFR